MEKHVLRSSSQLEVNQNYTHMHTAFIRKRKGRYHTVLIFQDRVVRIASDCLVGPFVAVKTGINKSTPEI